jgi:hypothetical protein
VVSVVVSSTAGVSSVVVAFVVVVGCVTTVVGLLDAATGVCAPLTATVAASARASAFLTAFFIMSSSFPSYFYIE